MKQIASEITTMPREPSSQTSTLHGERGLATPENSPAAAWLAKRSPHEVNTALASRASHAGIELSLSDKAFTTADGRTLWVTGAVRVHGEGDALAFADELRGFLTPAPRSALEGWLAELSVITARRQGDEFEEELRLRAYAQRLAAYPADVARHVCLVHSWRFWPSWAEMEEVCRAAVSMRHATIRALEAYPAEQKRMAEERARQAQIKAEKESAAASAAAERLDRWAAEMARPQDQVEAEKQERAEKEAMRRKNCADYIALHFPDVAARHPHMAEKNSALVLAQCEILKNPDAIHEHKGAFHS